MESLRNTDLRLAHTYDCRLQILQELAKALSDNLLTEDKIKEIDDRYPDIEIPINTSEALSTMQNATPTQDEAKEMTQLTEELDKTTRVVESFLEYHLDLITQVEKAAQTAQAAQAEKAADAKALMIQTLDNAYPTKEKHALVSRKTEKSASRWKRNILGQTDQWQNEKQQWKRLAKNINDP